MKVKEIMNSPITACSVKSNVWEVRDLMTVKGYSSIPVVEIEKEEIFIRGIISYKDLAGIDNELNVQKVMTNSVEVVSPDDDVVKAAEIMRDKKLHHLVVMNQGSLLGMISSFEFVKLIADKKATL